MATKRIYQIAKEIERDEKEIIAFLTGQGIKVGNRLSAVTEEAYELVKKKFLAPPEPEPQPEPKIEPKPALEPKSAPGKAPAPAESAKQQVAQPEQERDDGKKKKKKKKKAAQPAEQEEEGNILLVPDDETELVMPIYYDGMVEGQKFIENYRVGMTKKKVKASKAILTPVSDTWDVLRELKEEYPDSTPVRYWHAMDKLATKSFKFLQAFGLANRVPLAAMRNLTNPLGRPFAPREIFTKEETQYFDEQRKLLFKLFSHGMGEINDNLYALKRHAWDMWNKYEHMDFVAYATNPENELRSTKRASFAEMADAVMESLRGVARRMFFFVKHEPQVTAAVNNFLEWIDGYAKLKEQGANAEKLEKYLYLEKKLVDLIEFMSFDNLLKKFKNTTPYDSALDLLKAYRDTMDDPDAERNFKYKMRGFTNIVYKPKEYVFIYNFADLEPQIDYRPPEEIAAAKLAEENAVAENKNSLDVDEA